MVYPRGTEAQGRTQNAISKHPAGTGDAIYLLKYGQRLHQIIQKTFDNIKKLEYSTYMPHVCYVYAIYTHKDCIKQSEKQVGIRLYQKWKGGSIKGHGLQHPKYGGYITS